MAFFSSSHTLHAARLTLVFVAWSLLSLPSEGAAQSASERARELSESLGANTEAPPTSPRTSAPLRTRDNGMKTDLELTPDINWPEGMKSPLSGCNGCPASGCDPKLPSPSAMPTGGKLGYWILQIVGGIAILAAVFMLVRILWKRGIFDREDEENDLIIQARAQDEHRATDAAKKASYNEAIHALWLSSLLHIVQQGHRIPRAWTAREITRYLPVGPDARVPFETLSALAELAEFAEHTATETEYEQARDASEQLRQHLLPPPPENPR